MSLAAARRFIIRVSEDKEFRRGVNCVPSLEELGELLSTTVGDFSNEMFDDAIRYLHVRCQTHLQAEELEDLRKWWYVLMAQLRRGP